MKPGRNELMDKEQQVKAEFREDGSIVQKGEVKLSTRTMFLEVLWKLLDNWVPTS